MRRQSAINVIIILVTTTWPMGWTLDNGLASTPPMGIQTPFKIESNNEQYVKQLADEMINQGYQQLGYEYLIISLPSIFGFKNGTDYLETNSDRYPSGIKRLVDYVHSKGLKAGLRVDISNLQILAENDQQEYSQDDMKKHVQTLEKWNIDYVQLDDIRISPLKIEPKKLPKATGYFQFGKFLNETNKPILLDCSWVHRLQKRSEPIDYETIANHCNLYNIYYTSEALPKNDLVRHAGPGHWAYVGNPYYTDISNYNPAKWLMAENAIFAFPIMPDFELKKLSTESKDILQNEKIIEVNQDPLRIPGRSILREGDIEIAIRPITPVVEGANSYAVGFFNYGLESNPVEYIVSLDKLQLDNTNGYRFTDLFASSTDNPISFTTLPGSKLNVTISQGVALLKATPLPLKLRVPKK